jgi:alpha-beta hydrolase superfamily lysophospholipase
MNNKLLSAICLFILCWCGSISAQALEDTITLTLDIGTIEGTLLVADQSEKTPVVLIIAGSGPTDRNGNNTMMVNNSLKMLAESLLENGISSLRYDKRGVGRSQIRGVLETDLRFENYIDDARSWIKLLAKDSRFSEIIIIGHSEGALIGMIAAQDSQTDKYISLAGGGSTAPDILREQLKAQPTFVVDQAFPILDSLEQGMMVEVVPQFLFSLFRKSVQPYLISWFKYDPQEEVVKLDIPVLIVQGTTDIQVSVSEAELLHSANEQSEIHLIEGMNHILKEAERDRQKNIATYTNPDLPLVGEMVDVIVHFIKGE